MNITYNLMSKRRDKISNRLRTDKETDILLAPLVNDNKIREELRAEFENPDELRRISKRANPKMSTKITSSEYDRQMKSSETSSDTRTTKSSKSSKSSRRSGKKDLDFNDSDSSSDSGSSDSSDDSTTESETSVRSPYRREIPSKRSGLIDNNLLDEKLIGNKKKYAETPEEKRARARTNYSKLQDLVENHGVRLTRHFTISDDPDEMEAEYDMHKERRDKKVQVRFYKNTLLTIVCGIEFLNDKYDPFAFKLKDWSKQIAAEQDDYTEVLEELYEKYKDKGGKMAPEIRLLFMIMMSAITFHLSQTLFGPGGMKDAIANNPNILNQLMKTFMPKGQGSALDEPPEARGSRPNNRDILEKIKNRRGRDNTLTTTDTYNRNEETDNYERDQNDSVKQNLEKERRQFNDQKIQFEKMMKKNEDMMKMRMEQMRHNEEQMVKKVQHMQDRINYLQNEKNNNDQQTIKITNPPQKNTSSKFQTPNISGSDSPNADDEDDFLSNLIKSDQTGLSDSEFSLASLSKTRSKILPNKKSVKSPGMNTNKKNNNKINKSNNSKKNKTTNLEELLESLDESSEQDLSDIIKSTSAKKSATYKNRSLSKRKSDTASDIITTARRKKPDVIKL